MLNALPGVIGTVAVGLGGVWYAVMLYDRFVNKKKSDGD